ncbi:MAG: diguanylate cyclase, partial [Actinomycetia bacterium]|nr:diguanylate cyclase [Actinomycetes bacterium]
MKLFWKLLLAFVLVAAIPLAVMAVAGRYVAEAELTREVESNLAGLASLQEQRLAEAERTGRDGLALITSRTQLRISLQEYLSSGSTQDLARMTKILSDARDAVPTLAALSIVARDGTVVTSTDSELVGTQFSDPDLLARGLNAPLADEIIELPDESLGIRAVGPLDLDSKSLGALVADSTADSLFEGLTDYTGLGQTGETLLVQGDGRSLLPSRFGAAEQNLGEGVAVAAALAGTNGLVEGVDYRGEQVIADVRFLPEQDWVLIVKIDTSEAYAGLATIGRWFFLVGGFAAVLIVAAAWLVSRSMSLPMVRLSELSNDFGADQLGGDRSTDVDRHDEIGVLARSYNAMADRIETQQTQLRQRANDLAQMNQTLDDRVHQRTADLAQSEARTRSILAAAPDAIVTVDPAGMLRTANAAAHRAFGTTIDHIGSSVQGLVPELSPARIRGYAALAQQDQGLREVTCLGLGGTEFPAELAINVVRGEQSEPELYTLILRDITERKRAERYLQFLAHHDPMTGLANRPDFARRAVEALQRFRRTEQVGAILYLDIDGFKQVNDTFGHQCGDELLKAIADRIRTSIREVDSAARLGGDEFAVVLEAVTGQGEAEQIAERVREALAHRYQVADKTVHITASLGLAMITEDLPEDPAAAAETALNYADRAMYQAKRNGGDQAVTSTPQARRVWASELGPPPREARLRLWPLQQLSSATSVGITAELLWPETHCERPLSTGQYRELDRSIITTVLDQNQAMPDNHDLLCLPIHEATLGDASFPEWLVQTTTSRAFDPTSLVLKLDSVTRFKMNPTMRQTISQLADIGCSVQVSEFGAGYADIYTAHATPVHSLEIASVISNTSSHRDYVRAIVDFGHDLDLKIIVGNLETAHQVNRTRDSGCDLGWGPATQTHLEDTPLSITT